MILDSLTGLVALRDSFKLKTLDADQKFIGERPRSLTDAVGHRRVSRGWTDCGSRLAAFLETLLSKDKKQ